MKIINNLNVVRKNYLTIKRKVDTYILIITIHYYWNGKSNKFKIYIYKDKSIFIFIIYFIHKQ